MKATLFSLVYRVEAILSKEFEINSLKLAINDRLTIQKSLKDSLDEI